MNLNFHYSIPILIQLKATSRYDVLLQNIIFALPPPRLEKRIAPKNSLGGSNTPKFAGNPSYLASLYGVDRQEGQTLSKSWQLAAARRAAVILMLPNAAKIFTKIKKSVPFIFNLPISSICFMFSINKITKNLSCQDFSIIPSVIHLTQVN